MRHQLTSHPAKRLTVFLTSLSLVLSLVPTPALAEELDDVAEDAAVPTEEITQATPPAEPTEDALATSVEEPASSEVTGEADAAEADQAEDAQPVQPDEGTLGTQSIAVSSPDEPILTPSAVTAERGYALLTANGEIWTCDSQGNAARSRWSLDQKEKVTKLFVAADAKSVPETVSLNYTGSPSYYSVHIFFDSLRSVEFLTNSSGRSSVASIGKSAFNGSQLDEVINLDRTVVRSIGDFAFNTCTRLESISFPDTLIEIGKFAFEGCSLLNNVELPASVKALGSDAFYGCTSLDKLWVHSSSLPSIESWTFWNTPLEKGFSSMGSAPKLYAPARALWQLASAADNDPWKELKVSTAAIEGTEIPIGSASISGVSSKAWTGRSQTQQPILRFGGRTLTRGVDYSVSYSNNVAVGIALMSIQGRGLFAGQRFVNFTITKASQPMRITTVKRTVKASKVQKKAVVVASPIKFSTKAVGRVTYKKLSGAKALSVNAKTGKVTVKKRTKKGTYKIRIRVSATGNGNYKAGTRTVTCKVVVK